MGKIKEGRPTKFTPKVAKAIVDAVERGLTYRDAAALCGVSPHSITLWRKKGSEQTSGQFYDFFQAMARAQAIRTDRRIKAIEVAGLGSVPIRRVKKEPVTFNGIVMKDDAGQVIYKITETLDYVSDWKALAWLLQREWNGLYPKGESDTDGQARSEASKIIGFLNEVDALENGSDGTAE